MPLHGEITREIERGPRGPKVGAFFDLDRTLVAGFSAGAFVRERVLSGRMAAADAWEALSGLIGFARGRTSFSGFVAATTRMYRGLSESAMEQLGDEIFRTQLAGQIYPESRALVRAHRERGHTLAIVTSATRYQALPLARDLGIPHVLCTELEIERGAVTGRVVRPTCYKEGKATKARELARELEIDLDESWFYTDSIDDLPLLEIVGRPRPLNPDRKLTELAERRGWPVRRFSSRGAPSAGDVVRTGLTIGSIGTAVGAALLARALGSSPREAANLLMSTWGELGAALAGIDLHVTGEEHLWSSRPCVFIFNHQSAIDALLVCKLLRRDVVGVAKREIKRVPVLGQAFEFAGTIFLDRADRAGSIEALAPAVDALRRGLSIAIAPEGTRSPTPRLGPFKKGAFHIAMQAGAPIVPIVFRNALDALPLGGLVMRPASIEVVVHPPIATDAWKREELDAEVERIHHLYEDTLEG